jgi:hypothetical protein
MSNLSKPLMFVAAIVSSLWLTSHRATSAEQTKVLSAVGMIRRRRDPFPR